MPRLLCLFVLLSALPFSLTAKTQPNIVLYIADDHGRNDSSVYDASSDAITPAMAKLASAGLTFTQAFVASPACGPSRSALLSGLMPMRNGAEHNHERPRLETQIMITQMQAAGYEVACFGKVQHGAWAKSLQADHVDLSHNNLEEKVQAYLDSRSLAKPLLLIVGDVRTHAPWLEHDTYRHITLTIPDRWVDTPDTRRLWENYLGEVTEVDTTLGHIDDIARAHFKTDAFLYIYTSDHGHAWPFGKWNLYDWGTQVAFIARWPGQIAPHTRTDALISWIDIFPTFLDIVGGAVPADIDGRSFAAVLRGETDQHRDLIFTTHSGDGEQNIYPIRAVRDDRFKYIRNIHPEAYHTTHTDMLRRPVQGSYFTEWEATAVTNPHAEAVLQRYHRRPAVEFYDIVQDPGETTNLAEDPNYAADLARLAQHLELWMAAHHDTVRMQHSPYLLSEPYPGPGSSSSDSDQPVLADPQQSPQHQGPSSAHAINHPDPR
jgi:N-sulfoglucosamine sulfohydrolase